MRTKSNRRRLLVALLAAAIGLAWVSFSLLTRDLPVSAAEEPVPGGGAPEAAQTPDASAGVPLEEPPAQPGRFEVVGTVPLEGDVLQDQLVIFFSEELDPASADPPAELDPPVQGVWRVGPKYCAFRSGQFPGDQAVRVRLSESLRSKSGLSLPAGQREFGFAVFPFEPRNVFLIEETPDRTTLGITFPAPVLIESVQQHVVVREKSGAPVAATVEPGADARTFRLIIEGRKDRVLDVVITAGLTDDRGLVRLRKDRVFTYPGERDLTVASVRWSEYSEYECSILIRFSAAVHPDALRERLEIADAKTGAPLAYDLSQTEADAAHTAIVQWDSTAPLSAKVTIAAGLPGAERSILRQPYSTTLRAMLRPFEIRDFWWRNYGSSREGASLYLRLSQPVKVEDLEKFLAFDPALANMRIKPGYANAVEIFGDWASQQNYVLILKAGLPFGIDQVLQKDLRLNIVTEEVRGYLGFGYEGRFYFPRQAAVPLKLESRNLDKATLTLYRMFPGNIAVALEDMDEGAASWRFNEAWAERLAEKEVALMPGRDRLVETPIHVESLFLRNTRGVFSLDARGLEGSDAGRATKIIVWTDLGVLAHWQADGLALFVHNLYSLAPVGSASVTVYSAKNQVLGRAHTGPDGMALLSNFSPLLGAPRVVVIEHQDDYTFLELSPRDDDPVAFTESMPRYDRRGYDAFVYADRELYRPGETVHLHWLVRSNYGDAVGAMPLQARVIKPNGRTLLETPVQLSALGTGGLDVETQRSYPTGKYSVQVLVPGKQTPIGSYTFNLEDFVPNRIKVDVAVADAFLTAGVAHTIQVNGQHLFGAPAADRKAEASVVLLRGAFSPKNWRDYRFENDSEFTPETIACGEQRTDSEGNASFTFTYPVSEKATSPLRAVVVGRVFELGGRAVAGSVERVLFPSDVCLGLAVAPRTGGTGVDVAVAAVKPDETPADLGKVRVTLEKQVWNYYVRRYYTHHEPNWAQSFEPVETREVELAAGKGSVVFDMRDYGYYRVWVHSDATPQFSTQSFYSYGGQCNLVDAARPSLIKLTLDKPEYAVGETVRARIESPFDGKGVVVLQGEKIHQITAVDVQDGVGLVEFGLTRDHLPNVWIEATVVHALQAGRAQVYPFSSFAMANAPVRDHVRRVDVTFAALPVEVRPASEAAFTVETRLADGTPIETELTLAAVDEGIHSITGYKSPDPYAWLFRDRRPDFRRAHYYDKVAYDFDKPAAGGDLDALLGKRGTPPDESWIQPLALWSGPIRTDAAGRATVTFPIPEFTGQLRLVAVACSNGAVGGAEARVFVRRPYMLRTSMPRFLLPGDVFRCRAVVFNTTDAPVTAKVSWAASGTVRAGDGSADLTVPAGGEANCTAEFVTGNAVGQGGIRWEAAILDPQGKELERLVQDAPIPVRTPAAYQSAYELVVLKPGESRAFKNTRFIDDERAEIRIAVGANPLLQLTKALKFVVGYPYGCVEQVTSRLFPMYLLRQHMALFDLRAGEETIEGMTIEDASRIETYLASGIARIFSMQAYNGGLSTWPGGEETYPYGSVYALHFLTLVKRDREFEMPEEGFRALQRYVKQIALDWTNMFPSHIYTRAYALYVLALDGDLEAIQQIHRFDGMDVPRPARFLLAAALAMSTQDKDRVKLYLSTAPSSPYTVAEPDGALNSDIRAKAVELLALRQIGADPAEIAKRANALVTFLQQRHYGTTQETAFVIAALSQYLGDLAQNIDQAAATIAGPGGETQIRGNEVAHGEHAGANGEFRVSNTGKTDIYVCLTTSGVPEKPNLEPIAEGVAVRRVLYTSAGNKLEDSEAPTLRQGVSYVVGLEIDCSRDLKNLVVVDLLPAGLEIENPRLDADAIPGKTFEGAATPTYLEIRDDRLVLAFDALEQKRHYVYYVARAVTPGNYQHPPVAAECMYDVSVKGASALSAVEVRE